MHPQVRVHYGVWAVCVKFFFRTCRHVADIDFFKKCPIQIYRVRMRSVVPLEREPLFRRPRQSPIFEK
jgi:hypothetical protein